MRLFKYRLGMTSAVFLRLFIISTTYFLRFSLSQNVSIQQQYSYKIDNGGLLSKLMSDNHEMSNNQLSTTPKLNVNIIATNQSIHNSVNSTKTNIKTSDKIKNDQSIESRSLDAMSGTKVIKYVNKSGSNFQKKSQLLLKKSFDRKEEFLNFNNSSDDWICPNITHNRNLECGCDIKYTLRCSGDVHGLELIAEGLRKSNYTISLLDCTLKNVTVLSDARIFENVTLHGLFISSGEIKRVHRLAFTGLKAPLQILGLPNNALTNVPSNSLQSLGSLDRLDLSNNKIKALTSTDFINLQKLTYLELSENQISSISSKTFNQLKSLVTLKLNGNRLGDSPGSLKSISECINLRDLDLKANSIKGPLTQEKLPVIKTLETLSLDKNLFTSVQSGAFKNFPNLITLSLKNNQIDVLQDHAFNGLGALQKLDLGHNGIVTVSGGSLMHLNRVIMLDFSHNFLRSLPADIIKPLPMLMELRLDSNEISIIERAALESAVNLKNLSLRDNPLACDCKMQSFIEWLSNSSQLSSKETGALCLTPPHLENAPLLQVSIDSLTCDTMDANQDMFDNDHTLKQIQYAFSDISDNFTISNFSGNIKFVDYNFTIGHNLNLNWSLVLDKEAEFHSIFIFEESSVKTWLNRTMVDYRSFLRDPDEFFLVTVPSTVPLNLAKLYEFCLIFEEHLNQYLIGCSRNFELVPKTTINIAKIVPKPTIASDISKFDKIAERSDDFFHSDDDLDDSYRHHYVTNKVQTVFQTTDKIDDSILIYPSHNYYNAFWPNFSMSVLIVCLLISIIYIIATKYNQFYKIHRANNQSSISPSYSDDSINTQEDENENTTNKYVKLQATTVL